MNQMKELQNVVRNIIRDKKVRYVIGYAAGNDGRATPCFIRKPEEAASLIWDDSCCFNLTRYLADDKRAVAAKSTGTAKTSAATKSADAVKSDDLPVGIIVKGCDSRALTVLLQERYIDRSDVFVIGVSCGDSGIKSRPSQEDIDTRCQECRTASPVIYDVLIGDDVRRKVPEPFASLSAMEDMSADERWHFWRQEFEKCIRCHACRSICPLCYCDECVVDTAGYVVTPDTAAEEKAGRIKWIERAPSISDNAVYHLVRATHLAGRCVDCGECERACPVEIPLRLLNRKMEKEAVQLFGYEVGLDPSKPSLISCFREEDPEDFIR